MHIAYYIVKLIYIIVLFLFFFSICFVCFFFSSFYFSFQCKYRLLPSFVYIISTSCFTFLIHILKLVQGFLPISRLIVFSLLSDYNLSNLYNSFKYLVSLFSLCIYKIKTKDLAHACFVCFCFSLLCFAFI